MALKIDELRKPAEGGEYVADRRICLSADGEPVDCTDPWARTLLVGAGSTIPAALAERYGLIAPEAESTLPSPPNPPEEMGGSAPQTPEAGEMESPEAPPSPPLRPGSGRASPVEGEGAGGEGARVEEATEKPAKPKRARATKKG